MFSARKLYSEILKSSIQAFGFPVVKKLEKQKEVRETTTWAEVIRVNQLNYTVCDILDLNKNMYSFSCIIYAFLDSLKSVF